MKQALLLFVIFVIAFGATLLLSRDVFKPVEISDRVELADRPDADGDLSIKRRAEINRTMINPGAAEAAPEVAVEAGKSAAPAVGEIEGETKTDDGLLPRDLKVSVYPPGPKVLVLGGGRFLVADLSPGIYHVGVAAEGYIARRPEEVTVEAGKKKSIELWLEKGFELAGIVIEDIDQRPIQGALIDFNGFARVISDARGSFRTGIVPPKALDIITVTHDEFDRNYVIHAPMPDPQGITLAMSRGKGTVTGHIIPTSGQDAPSMFRVRIWRAIVQHHEELRRERTVRETASFEIKGVFDGANVLEVAFPGTTLATRRIEFDLNREIARHFEIDLNGGGRIEGTFTTPSNLVALQPVTLLDRDNHAMGETKTDAEGKFRFDQVPEGEYALRMDGRIPPIHTEFFKVEDRRVKTLSVDGQAGRLK